MSLASTGWPKTHACPSLAGSRPVSIFMVVVLPQPFEPRKPKISPRAMRKLTRSTATKSPKRQVRSRASIAGGPSGAARGGGGPGGGAAGGAAPRARASSATKAPSSESAPARAVSSAGAPSARTRPPSMATRRSRRAASSM